VYLHPKKKSRCPQPKLLAAQSLFSQTAEAFRKMATCLRQEQAANLYSDKQSAVDASRSAHAFASVNLASLAGRKICFHKSHVFPCGIPWCQ
jgi:hypothetical protein